MKRELGVVSKREISAVRSLSNSEYKEYRKAIRPLFRFSRDNQTFLIVRLNFDDFENLLKQHLEGYTKNASMGWNRMEYMFLEVNRRLLNYLSSVRTFLDHSETNLKRRYGRDSERVKHFKKACSEAYNDNFSYRFLYALRNYAQHCGMPVGQLTLHSEETNSKQVLHSLVVKFDRDELLGRYDKWGSQLKNEIQKLPSTFEINPHVAEMMKCIEKIFLMLTEDDLPNLVKSAEYVQQFMAQTKSMPGTPCILVPTILERSPKGKVKKLDMNIEWIPLHLVKMIMSFKAQSGYSE
jgi:hypothetical protein